MIRMKEMPAALLLLPVLTLASEARAGGEPCRYADTEEVIGAAADGEHYALRKVAYIGEEAEGYYEEVRDRCSYPAIKGKRPQKVELSLCSVQQGCKDSWTVYAMAEHKKQCTPADAAKRALAEAKAAFAAKGIDLKNKPVPIEGAMSADHLKALGVDTAVSLGMKKQKPSCNVVATARGYGSAAIHTAGRVPCMYWSLSQASMVPGSPLLFVKSNDWVSCMDNTGAVPLPALAARLINSRGLKAHKKKKYGDSARDFARSLELDPSFAQAAFNLACARARSDDAEGALDALAKAVKLDRETYVKRAKRDSDLEGLRETPRFRQLVQ